MDLQNFVMPAISERVNTSKALQDYSVKYFKADMDDQGDILELQRIETEGLKGDNIVLLSKDKFTFMDHYFIVISYMEKN